MPGISIMAAVLAAADIDAILGGQDATLFTPTNAALLQEAARRELTLPALFNDSQLLNDIARYELTSSVQGMLWVRQ